MISLKCKRMTRYVILSTIFYHIISAAPGCLSASRDVTGIFFDANYHRTACNCPCEKRYAISADRGQCSKCGHYRDPRETDTIRKAQMTAPYLVLKKPKKSLHLYYAAGGCPIKKDT